MSSSSPPSGSPPPPDAGILPGRPSPTSRRPAVSTPAATRPQLPLLLAAALLTVALLSVAAAVARPSPAAAESAAARAAAAAHGVAPQPGRGGWFWPIGSEDFGSYAGFLEPRGGNVHVAQDMHAKKGSPVYAVGDGTVWISRADTGGYGVSGSPGGCIIVVHRTGAGEEFRALYGHLLKLRVEDGDRVTAGQQIAVTNGLDHLHFGIHPSATYRERNPYAGEVPKSWKDHGGWVDPVKYLRTHPRGASYDAPALPVVKIVTGSAPADFGAASGVAYWRETTSTAPGLYAQDLASGERRPLAAGEAPPPFDAARYGVTRLAAPAVGLAVRDRLPVLTLVADDEEPAWGRAVALTGGLSNAAGKPFVLADLRLERQAGDAWVTVSTVHSRADGTAGFHFTPVRRTQLRLRFLLPEEQAPGETYVAPPPLEVSVAPQVALSVPRGPAQVLAGADAAFGGTLVPRHAAGDTPVRLEFQRLKDGAWATVKKVKATVADATAGSAYTVVVDLGAAGDWRLRAVHPEDAAHAATTTAWRTFAVD
jgi:murein DD-endopeptidase MepM/ murein hydrolase activator NlpD